VNYIAKMKSLTERNQWLEAKIEQVGAWANCFAKMGPKGIPMFAFKVE